jgi:hypothetical protein
MTTLVYRDGRDLGRGEFPFIHYRQTCTDGIGEALLFAGLKFFYLNTLGYDWPLFTKKKSAGHAGSGCPTSAVTRTAAA